MLHLFNPKLLAYSCIPNQIAVNFVYRNIKQITRSKCIRKGNKENKSQCINQDNCIHTVGREAWQKLVEENTPQVLADLHKYIYTHTHTHTRIARK